MREVDFTPKQYLAMYAIIVIPIALSFFFRRQKTPARLNLGGSSKASGNEVKRPGPQIQEAAFQQRSDPPPQRPQSETSLNIFFQWNGHTWDAYEVLGLPPGSSKERVIETYQALMTRSESESMPIIKAAFEAIIKNSSARR